MHVFFLIRHHLIYEQDDSIYFSVTKLCLLAVQYNLLWHFHLNEILRDFTRSKTLRILREMGDIEEES